MEEPGEQATREGRARRNDTSGAQITFRCTEAQRINYEEAARQSQRRLGEWICVALDFVVEEAKAGRIALNRGISLESNTAPSREQPQKERER